MKVLVYSSKPFEMPFLESALNASLQFEFISERLTSKTAIKSMGFEAISIFSADDASPIVLEKLRGFGVRYITLRSAGYDNVNVKIAKECGIKVANAPKYSPNAIAEHAIALLMGINRKLVLANRQVMKNNFSLDGLVGFNVQQKTIGVLGTGKIGSVIVKILNGFDCKILVNDVAENEELIRQFGVEYVSKDIICKEVDIIVVSLPLTSQTYHLVDEGFLQEMKADAILVNIARGAIVNTAAMLDALDSGRIAGYATDVYERESGVFFFDHVSEEILDKELEALINHPKVLLTPHQGFATREALTNIAEITVYNLSCWQEGIAPLNELT